MSTYLVTGGAGFIGSHIVEALVLKGETVRVIDNFSTGRRDNLSTAMDRVQVYDCDLNDAGALPEIFRGVDYVLHEAAIPSVPRSVADPMLTHQTCATATLNALIAARDAKVKRFVYAASSSAYGDIEGDYKVETMPTNPLSPYAVAKLTGEQYCQVFAQVYGMPTVALRYFNVFGPRQDPASPYSAVIPLFISAMLKNQAPTIYGDGQQSRDFTYIDNVVQGNLLACSAPAEQVTGEVINLACGDNITLLQLIDSSNKLCGTSIQPKFEAPRAGDVKHSRADISKARKLLGFAPVVPFDEGLARTMAWLKAEPYARTVFNA